MTKLQLHQDIFYYPVVLYYMNDVDTFIPPDKYKPASYDQWIMLKELEPSKFFYDYNDYVKSKQDQYEAEVESNKNVAAKLKSVTVVIDIRRRTTYEKAVKTITEIEQNPLFKQWVNKDDLDFIFEVLGKITK